MSETVILLLNRIVSGAAGIAIGVWLTRRILTRRRPP